MKDLEHWKVQCLSVLRIGAMENSSLVSNINITPQRPIKCFDNLVKKFDFNLIISNPKGSSNVKLGVTLEICTRKQEPKDSRNTS